MPGISFTPEDLASTNKLDAAWYKLKILDVVEGAGKKDPTSTTWTISLAVAEGPKAPTPVTHWLSTKMMDRAAIFMKCFVASPEAGKVYPIEETKGKEIMAYAQWDMERNSNVILDFKKVA